MTRLVLAVLCLTALAAAPACSRSGDRLGAGPDVDVCEAWALVDGLDEPDLSDRGATLRWAEGVQRIVERADLRQEVDDEPVPRAVVSHLAVVEEGVQRFTEELRQGGEDAVDRAFAALTASGFDESSDQLTDFAGDRC